MAEVTTSRSLNGSQLCAELGRVALRIVGPDAAGATTVKTDAVTQSQLQNAIDSHVADSSWRDPNPPPPTPDQEQNEAIRLLRERALEVWSDPTQSFTARQVQRILAALVLRATR